MTASATTHRFFVTFSGVTLPLALLGPLADGELRHRDTYYRATYDGDGRMVACEKLVYGDIHLVHRYAYHPGGGLAQAEIEMDDEVTVLRFDADGRPLAG